MIPRISGQDSDKTGEKSSGCARAPHGSPMKIVRSTSTEWGTGSTRFVVLDKRSCVFSREKRQDKYKYNEEFDPGAGGTLATGLTHASRGAAWEVATPPDGDRRTGE